MNNPSADRAASSAVDARLHYLVSRPTDKPAFYIRMPVPTPRRQGPQLGPRTMAIHDARGLAGELSVDAEGVELVTHGHDFADFYDPDAVRASYYPAVEQLVRERVGARRTLAFDHNLRSQVLADRGEHDAQTPVRFVHNDYTDESAPQRVRDLLPDEAEGLLQRRFAVINVWRPIHAPVQATPLAVCDAQSLSEGQLVAMDLIYPDRRGEVQSVCYDPKHRWLYFRDMQPHEAMLIKCFDSARDGRARYTAHTAFDDPTTPMDAPARESLEVRTLAFF